MLQRDSENERQKESRKKDVIDTAEDEERGKEGVFIEEEKEKDKEGKIFTKDKHDFTSNFPRNMINKSHLYPAGCSSR